MKELLRTPTLSRNKKIRDQNRFWETKDERGVACCAVTAKHFELPKGTRRIEFVVTDKPTKHSLSFKWYGASIQLGGRYAVTTTFADELLAKANIREGKLYYLHIEHL